MTTKTEILGVIKLHCLTCCGDSWYDVKHCKGGPDAPPHSQCILWPFRRGRDPNPSPVRVAECKVKVASQEREIDS